MHRYKIIREIHEGAFGVVSQAVASDSGDIVAIKRMKHRFHQWQECMELREVKALKRLRHPNIIKLREVLRDGDELFFVFEYCERNLFRVMKNMPRPFEEQEVRLVLFQVLRGLHYTHKSGVFHRDVKPENILCAGSGLEHLKLADFGLARDMVSAVPPLTDYVSTRWYRAPEILLKFPAYSWHVDIWAAGALMAELYLQRPLFPGTSEADQIHKMCLILGYPDESTWPELKTVLKHTGYCLPECNGQDRTAASGPSTRADVLLRWIPTMGPDAADLLSKMLSWNPVQRPSAREALEHPFFANAVASASDVVPPNTRT
jgi:male germ cell-associated kinase